MSKLKVSLNTCMILTFFLFISCQKINDTPQFQASPLNSGSPSPLESLTPTSLPTKNQLPIQTPVPIPSVSAQPARLEILNVGRPYSSFPCTDSKGNNYYPYGSYINVIHPNGAKERFSGADYEEILESSCKLIDAEPYHGFQTSPGVIKQYQKDGSVKYYFKTCLTRYESGSISQARYGSLGKCFINESDELFVFDYRFYIFHKIDLNAGSVSRFSGLHRNDWPENFDDRFLKDGNSEKVSFQEVASIVYDPSKKRLVFVDEGYIRSLSLIDGSVSTIINMNEKSDHDQVSITVNPDTGEIYALHSHYGESIYHIVNSQKTLLYKNEDFDWGSTLRANNLFYHKQTGMLLLPADKLYTFTSGNVSLTAPTKTPFQIFVFNPNSPVGSKPIQRIVIDYPEDFSEIYIAYGLIVEPDGNLIVSHFKTTSRLTFPNGKMLLTDTPFDVGYNFSIRPEDY